MPGWFSSVELQQAPPAAQRVFEDLCLLLDELNPCNLDPSRQTASTDHGEIDVHLVHRQHPVADLYLAIGTGTTHFYGIFGVEEAYSVESVDAVEAEVLELTRQILTSRYTVETQLWRGQPYRTLVRVLGSFDADSVRLDSVRGLIPRPTRVLRSSYQEFDYDCQSRPPEGETA